ncbi:putative colanic acid biosynthesis acetyltransferase [uncultured Pelagimonas sp.]|uniref:putative colanic acid biosynthesis acetyltransferase n=1 Tax=uncultured Pelagimonas sp. TaxID=1618102 RepID=UPI002612EB6C|nr:putative colanic acid biosynthesis acetyltransferase [uncultured Pelagimonas sp.]
MQEKPIAKLDLAAFQKPDIPGYPGLFVRVSWYLLNAIILRSGVLGLLPSRTKVALLRLYGAKLGQGVVIKPRVDIKSPWFLEVGDHVWIGEKVWIDNHTTVRIGSNSCLSQGAYLFTGNHDWTDPQFAFFCKPIEIGEGVWITAFAKVPPGSCISNHVAVMTG